MKSLAYETAKLQARMDALNCRAGNKPCGQRCISVRHKCKEGDGDKLHSQNAAFLYKSYGFDDASHSMSQQNPKMTLVKAKSYHKEIAYAIAKNDNPNRDIATVNQKYQHYFGK
jgi:hypothetical protein